MYPFDPDRVARLERDGWRAYYDRDWLKLLRLIVTLAQAQFHIPFPLSLIAAYHVTRAAAAWAPVDHDTGVVRSCYERFYRMARRFSGLRFDPERVAELELQYNDVHRRLVGQADKREFLETMVALHAALFDLPPERVRESAEARVEANNTVDSITGKRSVDPEADWGQIEEQLRRCYRSIFRELRGAAPPPEPAVAGSNEYHFVTHWRLRAPREEVADVLGDAVGLARWWPSVYLDVVVLEPGDKHGVGKVVRLHTKGRLPYTLRWSFVVTESLGPAGFTLEAHGDFEGRGKWTFVQNGPWVDVTYDWKIRADKPLLKRLSFLMRPIFEWNHRWAMARGEESLRLELDRRRVAR